MIVIPRDRIADKFTPDIANLITDAIVSRHKHGYSVRVNNGVVRQYDTKFNVFLIGVDIINVEKRIRERLFNRVAIETNMMICGSAHTSQFMPFDGIKLTNRSINCLNTIDVTVGTDFCKIFREKPSSCIIVDKRGIIELSQSFEDEFGNIVLLDDKPVIRQPGILTIDIGKSLIPFECEIPFAILWLDNARLLSLSTYFNDVVRDKQYELLIDVATNCSHCHVPLHQYYYVDLDDSHALCPICKHYKIPYSAAKIAQNPNVTLGNERTDSGEIRPYKWNNPQLEHLFIMLNGNIKNVNKGSDLVIILQNDHLIIVTSMNRFIQTKYKKETLERTDAIIISTM